MTDTLFDAVLAVARAVGEVEVGTADSNGTTTTLIDSNLGGDDDDWNGGTLFHIDDEEFSEITDYASSSGTVTILDAFTSATQSGDRYGIMDKEYRLTKLISAVNYVLTDIRVPKVDTSTVEVASGQSEYTLPTDCHDLRQVHYQWEDDTNDNQWVSVNFNVEKTAKGSANTLILPSYGLNAGRKIRLTYVTDHAYLYDDTDEIDEHIPLSRIVPEAVEYLLLQSLMDMNTADENIGRFINMWSEKAERARMTHRVPLPPKRGNVLALETANKVMIRESADD